ncbi:hypothetical protein RUM44_013166 [Polyplax serrata]|uniref:Uncharacterized protein n=1 Tax=Polyplax serrata TaxID=468196 RepID=A0ABR1BHC1_POLSC
MSGIGVGAQRLLDPMDLACMATCKGNKLQHNNGTVGITNPLFLGLHQPDPSLRWEPANSRQLLPADVYLMRIPSTIPAIR